MGQGEFGLFLFSQLGVEVLVLQLLVLGTRCRGLVSLAQFPHFVFHPQRGTLEFQHSSEMLSLLDLGLFDQGPFAFSMFSISLEDEPFHGGRFAVSDILDHQLCLLDSFLGDSVSLEQLLVLTAKLLLLEHVAGIQLRLQMDQLLTSICSLLFGSLGVGGCCQHLRVLSS